MRIVSPTNPASNPCPDPCPREYSPARDEHARARLQPGPERHPPTPSPMPCPDIPGYRFHVLPPPEPPPSPRPRTREERRAARLQSESARRLRRQQIREERAKERQLKEKQRDHRIRRRAERRSGPRPDLRPDWYCDSPEELRKHRRRKIRLRRSYRKRGRPPLRCRVLRSPTQREILDFALTLLWDDGRPNRNLLRVVRFLARDPSVPKVPGHILGKHATVADRILHNAGVELRRRFRSDHIGGLRYIRRGQLLKAKVPQGDSIPISSSIAAGCPAAMDEEIGMLSPCVRRRRFLLLSPSAGPPSCTTPPEERSEVLLCFPDGGLRVFAACVAAARGCASEVVAA